VVISGAEAALASLAEKLDAPVATTVSGQGAISEAHPLALGVVGSNGGTLPTRGLVDAADVIVFVGCRAGSVTTERWQHPAPGTARIVHLDLDPGVMGASYRPHAPVLADARLGLEALDASVNRRAAGDAHQRVARALAIKFAAFDELAASDATPIRPERLIASLQRALPEDAVVVADPGTPCPYVSAYYRFALPGRHFISNRAHGALGFSLAAAMGAQLGRPDAPCVAIMGDGSFGMAVGELETLKRLNLPVIVVVVANGVFGWIKAGQKTGFGERYFSVDFGDTDHAAVARAFGLPAWRVTDPAALDGVLREAVASEGPCLVDVVCQPLHEARAPVSEWIA
jgi:acetolactate synthase-1/2/3 large subunit